MPSDGWPQRLLHVPTMTSYEWQDGHRYGAHVMPAYSAISYTWGRYELPSPHAQPHVRAITIHGVSWAIPRIHEAHFTVAQFEALIRRSVAESLAPSPNPSWRTTAFEFLWLDVACINQTPRHPQKAAEIGRQAAIFRKAKRVLVWLNRTPRVILERAVQKIIIAAELAAEHHASTGPDRNEQAAARETESASRALLTGNEQWLTSALTYLKRLTEDKWFSSLWTLQEAFLSSWAYVISEETEPICHDSPQLHSIFEACETLNKICRQSVSYKTMSGQEGAFNEAELIDIVGRSGFSALAVENPMALYTVAANRATTRPVDYIYGIMQVFDFQLGVSAPNADPARQPALPELELQFGKRLIKDHPVMSQLHIHTKPVQTGQGWRVSSSSIVPEVANKVPFHVTRSFLGDHTLLCKLSYKSVDGVTWGWFSGKVCPFDRVKTAWLSIDARPEYARCLHGRTPQQVVLDQTSLVPMSSFSEHPQNNIPRDRRQHRLIQEMSNLFQADNLPAVILLLGRFSDEQHSEDMWNLAGGRIPEFHGDRFNIGLILIKPQGEGKQCWQRIGICIWDLSHLTLRENVVPGTSFFESLKLEGIDAPEKAFLEGLTDDWEQTEGLFG
ncbi:hypothetical protein MMC18_000300 [Xylographa bjoerkii]|nr:hypothetical protein [Xylographa bjoerkii]